MFVTGVSASTKNTKKHLLIKVYFKQLFISILSHLIECSRFAIGGGFQGGQQVLAAAWNSISMV